MLDEAEKQKSYSADHYAMIVSLNQENHKHKDKAQPINVIQYLEIIL